MSTTKYNHSVKVPRLFKSAAKTLKTVQEKGASLKGLIFSKAGKGKDHSRIKAIYALAITSIQNADALDRVIRGSQILMKERMDPWLARVLIAELIWGKKKLPACDAKPITVVLKYQDKILAILREAVKSGDHQNEPRQNKDALKPRYVRVNTLLMSVGDALTAFRQNSWLRVTPASDDYPAFLARLATLGENEFLQDYHVKQVFAFPPRTEFFKHELYRNGSLVLQDKATCLAPHLLNPTPGSSVLDMCAAPGIKTTQLAAIMENKGTLYAVERHPPRYNTLCEFVPRHGVTCVETIMADASTITPQECKDVEYILVDPTCSGSGMYRPGSAKEKGSDPGRLKQLAAFQVILLERALTNFPSVKRVVYSTCSIYPEENEQVVEKALAIADGRFKLVPALESWPRRGSGDYEVGPRCLLADPDKDMTTGFFVAVFERTEETKQNGNKRKTQTDKREGAEQAVANGGVAENKRKRQTNKREGAEQAVANGGVAENKRKTQTNKREGAEQVVANGGVAENKRKRQKNKREGAEQAVANEGVAENKRKRQKKDKRAKGEEETKEKKGKSGVAEEAKGRRQKKPKMKAAGATE